MLLCISAVQGDRESSSKRNGNVSKTAAVMCKHTSALFQRRRSDKSPRLGKMSFEKKSALRMGNSTKFPEKALNWMSIQTCCIEDELISLQETARRMLFYIYQPSPFSQLSLERMGTQPTTKLPLLTRQLMTCLVKMYFSKTALNIIMDFSDQRQGVNMVCKRQQKPGWGSRTT